MDCPDSRIKTDEIEDELEDYPSDSESDDSTNPEEHF